MKQFVFPSSTSHHRPTGTERDGSGAASTDQVAPGLLGVLLEKGSFPEREGFLRALVENSMAVMYVKDTTGRYLFVNTQFASVFGVSQAQVRGKTDYELFLPGQAAALRDNDLEVIASGSPHEFEEVVRHADGEHRYLSLKFPIPGPDGCPRAVGGISSDITERIRTKRCLVLQHGVTQALAESATLRDACPGVLRAVCNGLGWDIGLYWAVNPITRVLGCVEVWHRPSFAFPEFEQLSRELTLPSGVGVPGRILATGESLWIPDIVAAANFPRSAVALRDGLHAAYGFPVRSGREVLGVIEFFSRELRQPDPDVVRILDGIGSQLSQFLERREAERTLHMREREFEVARRIQFRLLPKTAPALAGFEIAGASYPAQETGGDYFDFIPSTGGSVGIAIGDASGHGVGAALVIAQTRAYLRAWATADADVGKILTRVNHQLNGDLPDGHFVTLFFARLDAATRSLLYSSAGHWPGYILDSQGEVRVVLESTGFPLGIDSTTEFPVGPVVALRSGDLVLLLTDGIVESRSADDMAFGVERVLHTVRECRAASSAAIVSTLRRAVRAFSDTQTDDMTAIVIKVR